MQIEKRLRKAIQKETIEVYYQPKVDARHNTVTGVEALVRWHDEELGFVSPEVFIGIAEEAGLIHSLWGSVMNIACCQISKWNKIFNQELTLAMNFSPRQFQDSSLLVHEVKGLSPCITLTQEALKWKSLKAHCLLTLRKQLKLYMN